MPYIVLPSRRYRTFRVPVWYHLDSTSTLDIAIVADARQWGWQVEAVDDALIDNPRRSKGAKERWQDVRMQVKRPKQIFDIWMKEHGRRILEADVEKGGKRTSVWRGRRVVDWLYQRGERVPSPGPWSVAEREGGGGRVRDSWESPLRVREEYDFGGLADQDPWEGSSRERFDGREEEALGHLWEGQEPFARPLGLGTLCGWCRPEPGEECPLGHLCPRVSPERGHPFADGGHSTQRSQGSSGPGSHHAVGDLIDLDTPTPSISPIASRYSQTSQTSRASRIPEVSPFSDLFRSSRSSSVYSQQSIQSAPSYATGNVRSYSFSDSDSEDDHATTDRCNSLQFPQSHFPYGPVNTSIDRFSEPTGRFRWRWSKEARLERAIARQEKRAEEREIRLRGHSTRKLGTVKRLLSIRWPA
ncbi:hypothetical protein BDV96DRAFT_640536 [Lophiotrema nucula]|uniref:Uncharacterized protein n=1 Tax=Lophiotrema nucula TaxID=690887 RepID=A0A6A5ZQK4_9PLEO|nr:hypothetical protein BDV96DRAFT_640536 [Lophiotrema nucula]